MTVLQVLIIEDNEDDTELLLAALRQGGFEPVHECVQNAEEMCAALARREWDVIISDFALPDFSGIDALRIVQERGGEQPFIVVSGAIGESTAVELIKAGAHDYHQKGRLERLSAAVERELRAAAARHYHQCTEQALRESEAQFRQLSENLPQALWIVDIATHRHVYVSPAYERIYGRSIDSLKADPSSWKEAIHPDDRGRVDVALASAKGGAYDAEFRIVHPDGTVHWLHERSVPVADPRGRIHRLAGITEDITRQREMEQRLLHLAHYDGLTGLPNRTLFCDRVAHALAQAGRNGWTVAVLLVDLDRFMRVNDTFGHEIGNRLLREVGQLLLTCLRTADSASRLTGDEFALLLPDLAHPQDAALVAGKVLAALSRPLMVDGHEIFVSASIGIALHPGDGKQPDTLIRNANAAMSRAKALGRNKWQFYTMELNADSGRRLQMENALRHALDRGEFMLHYQPRINLISGQPVGVEALLRWQHPERGLVVPGEFIPLLEDSGLIVPVGEWVLGAACRQMRDWLDAGIALEQMAVNLSGRQFQQPNLVTMVRASLSDARLDPRHLELEITESFLMENADEAAATLRALRSTGIRLSVDDFGTGYSSLSYLKRFPVNALKIDRAFVKEINSDPADASIARAIISLAHGLRLKVIAEGVETEGQAVFLCENYCDEIQGYLCAPPLDAAACRAYLAGENGWVAPKSTWPSGQRTLLLAAADGGAHDALRRLLARDGYRILTATSAEQALDVLATHEAGVVLSEEHMPGMSGVEFLARVKLLHPKAFRLMLADCVNLNSVISAINDGAFNRFLVKPWDDASLRAQVEEAFRHHELACENDRLSRRLRQANDALLRANRDLEQRVEERARELLLTRHGLQVSHLVFDELPLGIIGVGEDDVIAVANRRAGELLGDCAVPLGESASECLPPEIANAIGRRVSGMVAACGLRFSCFPLQRGAGPAGHLVVLEPQPVADSA
jgi:diguanylate cyclase (GGDEF)-like protein/PAS domain S-box-containing protein